MGVDEVEDLLLESGRAVAPAAADTLEGLLIAFCAAAGFDAAQEFGARGRCVGSQAVLAEEAIDSDP